MNLTQLRFGLLLFLALCLLISFSFPFPATAQTPQVVTLQRDVKPASLTLGKGELTVTLTLNINSATCPTSQPAAKPLDIVLVMDHSGSMGDILGLLGIGGGTKLTNAKQAAKSFLAQVSRGTDNVALIQFDSSADLLQQLDLDLPKVERAIDSITIGGGTAIDAGVNAAFKELSTARRRKEADPVIVLLTDGQSTESSALASAKQVKDAGARLITIGLGMDVNANLLRAMASQSSDYYFAPESRDLAKIYEDVAKSIKKPTGITNLKIRHTFDASAFQPVPGSVTPSGVVDATSIVWSLPSASDGTLTFSYKLTPRSAGRFNIDAGDEITFNQCENTPGNLAEGVGLPVVIATPPPPSPTPTSTPPPPTFTPAPKPATTPVPAGSFVNQALGIGCNLPLWIPCLLLPLILFAIWFIRKFLKEWNRGPEKRHPCPLVWWLLLPLSLLLLWLIFNQVLTNVCLGAESVYFWRIERNGSSGIYVTSPDGQRPARPFAQVNKASQCVGCHAVSNNSKRIALIQDGGIGPVAVFGLDGKRISIPKINASFVTWSPDGKKLALSTDKRIIEILDVQTGAFTPLIGANDPGYSQLMPAWSPDGNAIAFVRSRDPNGIFRLDQPSDIFVVPATGGNAAPLSGATGGGFNYYPAYSPDGKWIAFTRHSTGRTTYSDPNAEIYIIPATGGTAQRLAANDATDGSPLTKVGNSWPAWSRDGQYLVFNSKRNGEQFDIYMTKINPDGTSGPAILLPSAADPTAFEHLPFWGEPPQIDPLTGVLDLWPWLLPFLLVPILYWICRWFHKPVIEEAAPVRSPRRRPDPLAPVVLPADWQVAPTLVLGVGGTGRWVLTHLKKNLCDSGMGVMPEKIRLVLLDTSEREEANVVRDAMGKKTLGVEFAGESLDSSEMLLLRGNLGSLVKLAVQDAPGTEPYREWFPAQQYRAVSESQLNLASGTQGRRPLARAGLVKNLGDEQDRVESALAIWKLLTEASRQVLDDGCVRVIVVGSLAGGMSGVLFDLAHLARLAGKSVVPKEGTVKVEAYLATHKTFASVGGNKQQRQVNTFAAARELQRFQLSQALPFPMCYKSGDASHLNRVVDTQLFDDVYLFGQSLDTERSDGKSTEPWATTFAAMADVIAFRMDSGIKAGTNQDYRSGIQRDVGVTQAQKNVAVVGGAGSFFYRLPLRDMMEQIRTRWARQLLHEFLQNSAPESRTGAGSSIQVGQLQSAQFLSGTFGCNKPRPDGMSVIEKLSSGEMIRLRRVEMDQVPDASQTAARFHDYLAAGLSLVLNGEKEEGARAERIEQAKEFLFALAERLGYAEKAANDLKQTAKADLVSGLERAEKLAGVWRAQVEKAQTYLGTQNALLHGRQPTAAQSRLVGLYERVANLETQARARREQMDRLGVREYLWWRVKDPKQPLTDPDNRIDLTEEWYLKVADPEIAKFLARFYWELSKTNEPQLMLVGFQDRHIVLTEQTIETFVNELLEMGTFVAQEIWKSLSLAQVMQGRNIIGSEDFEVATATRMWSAAMPYLQSQLRDKTWGAAVGIPSLLRTNAPGLARIFGDPIEYLQGHLNPTRTVVAELTDQFAVGLVRTHDLVPISEIPEMLDAKQMYENTLEQTLTAVEGAELQAVFAAERNALIYEKRLANPEPYPQLIRQFHPLIVMALEHKERAVLYALAYAAQWIAVRDNAATMALGDQSPRVLARQDETKLDLRVRGLLYFCQQAPTEFVDAARNAINIPSESAIANWRKYYGQWIKGEKMTELAQAPQEVQDFETICLLEVFDKLTALRGK